MCIIGRDFLPMSLLISYMLAAPSSSEISSEYAAEASCIVKIAWLSRGAFNQRMTPRLQDLIKRVR
jgi:hypothetical protein